MTAAVIAANPVGQAVEVLVPSFDNGERRHTARGYKPDPDGTEAKRGDACCVVEDNTGQLWLLAWEAA